MNNRNRRKIQLHHINGIAELIEQEASGETVAGRRGTASEKSAIHRCSISSNASTVSTPPGCPLWDYH